MVKEVWAGIDGYGGMYSVSTHGRVISRWSGTDKFLNINHAARGYIIVALTNPEIRKAKTVKVHRVVALTFLKDSRFDGAVVNHKDSNTRNNMVDNLEWVTSSENMKHAYRAGRKCQAGERNNLSKFMETQVRNVRNLFKEGVSRKDIAEITGISRSHVTSIVGFRRWRHLV